MTPYAEVIGDPIGHSKSPAIHTFWLRALGMEGEYRAVQVRSDGLGAYFDARAQDPAWRGCNVTMPHKRAVLDFVHMHRDPSFPIEPANAVLPRGGRLEGKNFDTVGLFEPLSAALGGIARDRGPAIVVGAGGVLFSVMWTLSALGFAPIHVVLRDVAGRGVAIAQEYSGVQARIRSFAEPLPEAALLVNASPLGMTGFPDFPFALDPLPGDALVFDLVYAPLETGLLRAARARGLRTIDGLAMLIAQAAVSFQAFFGAPAPRAQDGALRALLTS
jgi:shikimate dehydrogenase